MRILNDVKHRHAICFKFGDNFFSSLTMSGLILSQGFGICCRGHKLTCFNNKVCLTKKRRL